MFPSEKRNMDKRKIWIKLLKRQTASKGLWQPRHSDRVCSLHFVDGIPTCENPYPSLNLGYSNDKPVLKRRQLFRKPLEEKAKSTISSATVTLPNSFAPDVPTVLLSPPSSPTQTEHTHIDHDYTIQNRNLECSNCKANILHLDEHRRKIIYLTHEIEELKEKL